MSRRVTPVKQSNCLEPPEVDQLLGMPPTMNLPDGGMRAYAGSVCRYACTIGSEELDWSLIQDKFLTVIAVSGGV